MEVLASQDESLHVNSTDTAEEEPKERNGVQMTQLEPGLNLPQG